MYCIAILMVSCNQTKSEDKKNVPIKEQALELPEKELESKENKTPQNQDTQDQEAPKTEEELISDIREKFGVINYNSTSYKKITKDVMGESTQGGGLEAYFKDRELRKIVVTYYGEMGKSSQEYYFWDNELFFAFIQEYLYNKPMYMEGSKVEKIDENRYYFYHDKLIRWLDPKKEKVNESKFIIEETRLLQNVKELKEKLK